MTTPTEEDLYRFAESSYVFDLPKDNEWDLRYPEYQIEYTVAVIKLWMESCYVLSAKEWQEQEPVGFTITGKLGHHCSFKSTTVKKGDKVYTHPKEWQELSDDEKTDYIEAFYCSAGSMKDLVDSIEQALKEKNT